MLLADRQSTSRPSVTEIPQSLSQANQQLYARLRLALGLGLRRQLLIAVCDDSNLRHQLAHALTQDVAKGQDGWLDSDGLATPSSISKPASAWGNAHFSLVPHALINLKLRTENPNLISLLQQKYTQKFAQGGSAEPVFQVLGIEQLTRQPSHIQHAFLNQLRTIGRSFGDRPWSLVLWVSRPWQRAIQQSAPEFWRWHTGLFEFEGDPLPLITRSPQAERTEPIAESSRPLRSTVQPPRLSPSPSGQPTEASSSLADSVLASVMQSMLTSQVDGAIAPEDVSLPPLQLLQQIEQLQQQSTSDAEFALGYRQLGNWYRDRAGQEAKLADLKMGIQAYEQAILHLQEDPATRSDVLNDVGNLYWMLARQNVTDSDQVQALQTAIQRYETALSLVSLQATPQRYAMLQNNLGAAYSDLAHQSSPPDVITVLQKSIVAYTAALQSRPDHSDPQRSAAIHNNLGTTYWNLAQHTNPVHNLQQAIAAYQAALPFYDPQSHPLPYAMIQNNLGTAYWNLAQCDNLEEILQQPARHFLQQAIAAYQLALEYRTPEVAPVSYAASQNNLGTAYWNLANEATSHPSDVISYLQHAIAAYQSAIEMVDTLQRTQAPNRGAALNFDPYATHHNLASAYYQAATQPHIRLNATVQSSYLDAALQHHLQAWQGWHPNPDLAQTALEGIVQVVQAFHTLLGIQGQTRAMSQLPAHLLPSIMQQL